MGRMIFDLGPQPRGDRSCAAAEKRAQRVADRGTAYIVDTAEFRDSEYVARTGIERARDFTTYCGGQYRVYEVSSYAVAQRLAALLNAGGLREFGRHRHEIRQREYRRDEAARRDRIRSLAAGHANRAATLERKLSRATNRYSWKQLFGQLRKARREMRDCIQRAAAIDAWLNEAPEDRTARQERLRAKIAAFRALRLAVAGTAS